MATDNLSTDDDAFLAICEEEFKDRYTEKDEDFMKVFNAEPSDPPIIPNWWVPQNCGRRNDRHTNRRFHPYDQSSNQYRRHQNRGYQDRSYEDQGYQDRRYQNQNYRDRENYPFKRRPQ